MPIALARPRSSSILSSSFGLLLGEPHVHRARDLLHLLHEVAGDRHQPARVGAGELDLHRLPHALVEIVDHDVLGADQLRQQLAQVDGDLERRALPALLRLADVDVHAAAARVDGAVGRDLGLRNRARELGCLLDLELRVLEARRGRRAHVDRDGAVVRRRQERRAADR